MAKKSCFCLSYVRSDGESFTVGHYAAKDQAQAKLKELASSGVAMLTASIDSVTVDDKDTGVVEVPLAN